jgi:hypothetical protein
MLISLPKHNFVTYFKIIQVYRIKIVKQVLIYTNIKKVNN